MQAVALLQRGLTAFEKQADVFAGGGKAAQATLAAGLEVQQQFGVPVLLGVNAVVDDQHDDIPTR